MNNLIINGIDHGKFDLEWANHGGIIKVYSLVYKQPNTIHQYEDMSYFGSAKFIDDEPDGTVNVYMLNKRTAENKNTKFLAMATAAECAEAGIEYIEPPARWLPIESAPKDGTKVVLLTPTGDMLSPCEFVEGPAISETGAWLWWQVGPEWFTEVKNPTHYMILPKLPEETK